MSRLLMAVQQLLWNYKATVESQSRSQCMHVMALSSAVALFCFLFRRVFFFSGASLLFTSARTSPRLQVAFSIVDNFSRSDERSAYCQTFSFKRMMDNYRNR